MAELKVWKNNHARLKPIIDASPVLKEIEPMSQHLSVVAGIGLKALEHYLLDEKLNPQWVEEAKKKLTEAKKPQGCGYLTQTTGIPDATCVRTL